MTPEEEAVGRYYDEHLLDYELQRLEVHWVEFGMTLRALERWAGGSKTELGILGPGRAGSPAPVQGRRVAVEIGVGSGAYSSWLAARGFNVYLVDVSEKLLAAAQSRLEREQRVARVLGAHHAAATNVSALADAIADVLLALGPLYHLRAAEDRRQAVREAFRLLKPEGLIFAAGVNRMAYLTHLIRDHVEQGAERRDELLRFLRDGNIDDFGPGGSGLSPAKGQGYAHLSTPSEFAAEFRDGFDQIALLGLESFVGINESKLAPALQADRDAWLDVVENTAHLPDGLGCSSHFLYVGRRKTRWTES